jgi:hypothetical protein
MKTLFPYDTLVGDVDLVVRKATVDGHAVPAGFLEPERRLLAVAAVGRETWQLARLDIEVTAPQTEVKEFIANGAPPSAVVTLHGGRTNMRMSVRLAPDAGNPARWTGTLEIDRPYWYGRLELGARIVAPVGGVPGRIIGDATPWSISLDDVPRPPVRGNIPVRWDDFRTPESLAELKRVADQPFYLHLDADEPVLYLNDGFTGLRSLLEDRARRPRDAQVLHDQTRVTIATATWTAMFEAAVAVAAELGEPGEPELPSIEWQRNVLEILLGRMYEERTLEDAIEETLRLLRQGDGYANVQSLLANAVSEQVGGSRLLRASINRLDNLDGG